MTKQKTEAAAEAVRVQFVERENGSERLVCEAEIVFGDGPLTGMKLVGFSLWRGPDGEVYVTFPSLSRRDAPGTRRSRQPVARPRVSP